MRVFHDETQDVAERSTERMNFRTKPRIKEAIQRAAALSGVDDSVFTMSAAYRFALETIAAHERTVLQAVDHSAFFAAIDNPPEPSEKLRAAFARHREAVQSK
ncbi:DUF1778 domain-containing protein [Aureimonas sp. ME7]|uniref:type II toxin-antitoxin system TacA family antitoxin n=1 Tax=Aureimonas sp. ME7 TaxID=2744252 RepID=UPI0015F41E26|nr:DUF1778 domain-containing protein [Aureimonas sp. ME7]